MQNNAAFENFSQSSGAAIEDIIKRTVRHPFAHDNKYTRGVLHLCAGSLKYPGAGVLSALAASASGLGYLKIYSSAADEILRYVPESVRFLPKRHYKILRLLNNAAAEQYIQKQFYKDAVNADALAIGSGLSYALYKDIDIPAVFDAGALNSYCPAYLGVKGAFSPSANDLDKKPIKSILTPHIGEFKHLLRRFKINYDNLLLNAEQNFTSGTNTNQNSQQAHISQSPFDAVYNLEALKNISKTLNAVIVLKGNPTYIISPKRVETIASESNFLATAGTGDVLTGVIGALLACNMAYYKKQAGPHAKKGAGLYKPLESILFDISISAVCLHIQAAKALKGTFRPTDLACQIRHEINRFY